MNRPILKLAAGRVPKKPTVVYKATTLGEHKQGFLNANNSKQFLPEEEPENPHSLSAILRNLLEREFITKIDGKEIAEQLTVVSEGTIKARNECYKIISRVLGYQEWSFAIEGRDNQKRIKNLNYGRTDINLELFGLKDSGFVDKLILYGADRLEKVTYYPLKLKQFLYEFKLYIHEPEFVEIVSRLIIDLAQAIDRCDPLTDLVEQTRFFFRSSKNDPSKGRVCAVEFIAGEERIYKSVSHLNVTLEPDRISYGRKFLAIEETIHSGPYHSIYSLGGEYAGKYKKRRNKKLKINY